MRLRRPCEHGRYEEHWTGSPETLEGIFCPGGEFLADDTLILSKEDAERRVEEIVDAWAPDLNGYAVERFTAEILDVLAVREGEGIPKPTVTTHPLGDHLLHAPGLTSWTLEEPDDE